MSDIKNFYEQDASEYDEKRFTGRQRWQDHEQQQMLGEFLDELPDEAHILEIGCGSGRFTERMVAEGFRVTAVDIAKPMLQETKDRVDSPLLTTILGDVTNIGFNEQNFDAVVMINVVSHVPTPQDAFFELHRVLKRGGRLFVNFTNLYSLYFPVAALVNYQEMSVQEDVYSRWYARSEMRSLLYSEGFLINRTRGHCFPPRSNGTISAIVQRIDSFCRDSPLKYIAGNLFIHATRE